MVLMVIVISAIGYGIARGVRYYVKQQRIGLLEPPVDLLDEFKKTNDQCNDNDSLTADNEPYTNRTRYSKAQARQRFKRGKT